MCKARNRIRSVSLLALSVLAASLQALEDRIPAPASGDTVIIYSAEAWEDQEPNIIHFRGDFQLNTGDWRLSADQATLYGKLDDPETVILTGNPAVMLIETGKADGKDPVTASASRIVYQKENNSISMEGGASLNRGDNMMQGSDIVYTMDDDRFSAGGFGGVRIKVNPDT